MTINILVSFNVSLFADNSRRVSSNCATFSRLLSRSNTRTTRMNNASRLIASRPRRLADTTPLFPDFSTREKRLLALFFFFFFWKAACATQIYTDVIFELYYSNVNLKIVDTSHHIVSCNKLWNKSSDIILSRSRLNGSKRNSWTRFKISIEFVY